MTNDIGKITAVENKPLSSLVFGAGAIGTYIGGSLLLSGQRAVFLEQPAVAEALKLSGLRLNLAGAEQHIENPTIAASLSEALQYAPFDIAIFALKSFDTQAALDNLAPYRDRLPPVLCLQNGVENEMVLASVFGEDKVIAGTVTSAIGRRAAGDIVLERKRGIGVFAGHPLCHDLVASLNQAGLNAHSYPSAAGMKWSKMLTNLLANATSAILALPPDDIFSDPFLFDLEIRQLREALGVMSAMNIPVTDLPGTPVRALALAVRYLPQAISRPFMRKAVGGGRGGKMPSFYLDLHSGRGQSEANYLNGAVVRFGEQAGVPTPVNTRLNEIMQDLVEGRLPVDAYAGQPEKLLQRITS